MYTTVAYRGTSLAIRARDHAIMKSECTIARSGGGIVAVEAKATATPTPSMAQGIVRARGLASAIAGRGYLMYLGDAELPLGPGVLARPLRMP
jgi:hypothetical protein